MQVETGNPGQWLWLWLVPALAVLLAAAALRDGRLARRFATTNLIGQLFPPRHHWRSFLLGSLAIASLGMVIIAMVDLRWGKVTREVPQRGLELIFLLDVSRSMLAEDVTPNRLERAKQQIKDTLDVMAGDRAGLTLFAGEVRRHIPLTSHYEDFKIELETVGPHLIPRGGSKLGDAIRIAGDGFLEKTGDHKAIVILSDGEDQSSEPVKAARKLQRDSGVRVFAIGLGDDQQGARIPLDSGRSNRYVEHDGQPVWTKLDSVTLKQVAEETGGAYIPARTKQVNMSDVYHRYISEVEPTDFGTAEIDLYEARFQWFLGPGIVLLFCYLSFSGSRPRSQARSESSGDRVDANAPHTKS